MIREVNQASAISSFCIGLLLNVALIWLVLRKSPAAMRVFSRILLQTCFTDLLMLTATLLTQPIYTLDNGTSIVVLNGFVRNLGGTILGRHNVVLFLWDNCFFFAFFGLSAQFIYRYLLLNRNAQISTGQYFGTLFGILLPLDFALASLLYLTGHPSASARGDFCCQTWMIGQILNGNNQTTIELAQKSVGQGRGKQQDVSAPATLTGHSWARNKSLKIISGNFYVLAWLIVTACITCAYGIIFYCTFAIVQYVKRNLNKNATGEINQQITQNMLIQSLLPLLSLVPVWFTLTISLANLDVSNSAFLQTMMLIRLPVHWLPVFNPIVTMLTVKHYKNAIRRMLLPNGISTIVPGTGSKQTNENRGGNLSCQTAQRHQQRMAFANANMPIISQ